MRDVAALSTQDIGRSEDEQDQIRENWRRLSKSRQKVGDCRKKFRREENNGFSLPPPPKILPR